MEQRENQAKGSATLGAIARRYGPSKKLAEEDRKKVLQKAKALKANQTETGKPADPVELDPVKQGMQNTALTN